MGSKAQREETRRHEAIATTHNAPDVKLFKIRQLTEAERELANSIVRELEPSNVELCDRLGQIAQVVVRRVKLIKEFQKANVRR